MAVTSKDSKKELFGSNSKQVTALIDRLANAEWYQQIGTENGVVEEKLKNFMEGFDMHGYETQWVPVQEVPYKIRNLQLEGSRLWDSLKEIPDRIDAKAKETGRKDALNRLAHELPELVYHGSFEGAYRNYQDKQTVSLLVGHAMYISLLACSWEVIRDQSGWEENPFLYLIDIVEEGHLPLGPYKNTFQLS